MDELIYFWAALRIYCYKVDLEVAAHEHGRGYEAMEACEFHIKFKGDNNWEQWDD